VIVALVVWEHGAMPSALPLTSPPSLA
jgi:hypothetical protein